MKRVAGLVLGAGKSQRMGSPKALLRIFGTTFLEHIHSEACRSKLADVRIVLGHHSDLILEKLPQLRGCTIINPDYELGQLSSLVHGLGVLKADEIDGLMLFLVDHPFVNRDLIDRLIERFSAGNAPIVIPAFQRKRGHPLIFGRELFPELLSASIDQGAIVVVRRHQERILHVEVEQEGILIDIDTPEAYQKYVIDTGRLHRMS